MRSAFAVFLRGFVLPFGATTGRRIEFNGVDGSISFYRTDGTKVIQIGGTGLAEDAVTFPTGDVDEVLAARIRSSITGAGVGRNIVLNILGGAYAAGATPHPQVTLRSSSQDGTETSTVEFNADGRLTIGMASGANDPAGEAVLVAGTVVVPRTTVTATSLIYLSRRVVGGTPGHLSYVRNAGVGFTINSTDALDTSTVSYLILNGLG